MGGGGGGGGGSLKAMRPGSPHASPCNFTSKKHESTFLALPKYGNSYAVTYLFLCSYMQQLPEEVNC